jgi:hypothetical protein
LSILIDALRGQKHVVNVGNVQAELNSTTGRKKNGNNLKACCCIDSFIWMPAICLSLCSVTAKGTRKYMLVFCIAVVHFQFLEQFCGLLYVRNKGRKLKIIAK